MPKRLSPLKTPESTVSIHGLTQIDLGSTIKLQIVKEQKQNETFQAAAFSLAASRLACDGWILSNVGDLSSSPIL